MTFENFKKALDYIRSFDKYIDTLGDLKINIIDSDMCDAFWRLQGILFTEIYGKNGYEWISYYLCEIPMLKSHSNDDEDKENEVFAYYADGTPIDLSSDEALWKFLENNYKTN